ncbi:MAG: prephenate dehydrogenase [Treponema sp.]|nr:prephenate dehydrogenase [Treponema sp.]
MKKLEDCTIGIAGLGLMGGAFAMALRKLAGAGTRPVILAHDTDDRGTLQPAEERNIIDKGYADPAAMLPRCDVVYLCLNPSALIRFTETNMAAFKSGALITDIGGIKTPVAALAERMPRDLDFIPGHPMAGSEKKGLANAGTVDFTGKNYILTPLERNKPENLAFLKGLIHRIGFGKITETTAADHDDKIAFTSQLCHVIAASLIDCEADTEITRYGGGSFEDLTRIAMLNAPMWTEIFLENSEKLLGRIARFEKSLDEIKALIAAGRGPELETRLAAVRDRRCAMG